MASAREQLIDAAGKLIAGKAAIGGLSGCAFSLAVAAMAKPRLLLCLTPGPETAEDVSLDLDALAPGLSCLTAPVMDDNNPDKQATWISLLSQVSHSSGPTVLLTPAAALIEGLPAPDEIKTANLSLKPGSKLKLDPLFEQLVAAGLQRLEQVDSPGQFARRGGIVDIFPPTLANPVRIELFGDEIESVRSFDVQTQRSFESLEAGIAFPLVPVEGGKDAMLLDYLKSPTVIAIEPERVAERLKTLASFTDDPVRHARVERAHKLLGGAVALISSDAAQKIECVAPVSLGDGYEGVAKLLAPLLDSGLKVLVFGGTEAELRPAREGLEGQGLKESGTLQLFPGDVEGGRVLPGLGFAILSLHELLGRSRRRLRFESSDRPDMGDMLDDFIELEPGDYVVHLQHGIARFKGMETLNREGKPGEFLSLEFADNITLHVPATNADVVQKYIGMRGMVPQLSRLNTQAWSERKLRAQHSVLKLASDMLEVQAIRAHEAGHPCRPDGPEMAEYEAACPFRDTPDQAKSSISIKRDLESRKPMDRLLCGDVGYGKTELAMRAAFKMVLEGRQVAILVPTTVLAQQHYLTFSERLRSFPVIVDLLSRFRSAGEQRKTIEQLAEGKVDIVIGTHRLLSQDVQFKNLGLVVIDEEQRFGVEHKERLKHMRRTVDLLTLSATPIPRTLHQALLGLRDISNLTTPPQDRLSIITRLMHWNDREIADAIQHEIARDGQVFFVHNRVYDIELVGEKVQRLCPDARVEIGHGQMPERQLEEVMLRFMNRQIDVLVSTTIIESGIDVRTANTIIIDQAQNYGLSDLHQLRGRVGRYHNQAYCYLLVPDDVSLSEIAAKRLKAILQYHALGSGFKIAMRDLELRGAGNLLGAEQSGHIATIGYDLYCRMLDRAVRKMNNQPVPPEIDTQLDLGIDFRIPRGYIPSQKQRLEVYRRLARIGDDRQSEEIGAEIRDRFGKPPREFEQLMQAALVRSRLARLGITSVARAEDHIKLRALSASQSQRKLSLASKSFRVLDESTLALPLRKGLEQPLDQLRFLSNLLSALARQGVFSNQPEAPAVAAESH
ncbi:MAG: transcription-repair coupling factor [Planctomycetes bacterium]|nr:transcription-repair coupling factor [Planctomycetota bacterium]